VLNHNRIHLSKASKGPGAPSEALITGMFGSLLIGDGLSKVTGMVVVWFERRAIAARARARYCGRYHTRYPLLIVERLIA